MLNAEMYKRYANILAVVKHLSLSASSVCHWSVKQMALPQTHTIG